MMYNQESNPLSTPVLFIIFNRPDTTRHVFEAIRQAKPLRLYVAADGPRKGVKGEARRVKEVRDYVIDNVDWECEVHTLFQNNNIGCKYGPQRGISWFFEHEEEGIILEDDCLPHQDFFHYCEFCLDEFRENQSIWHINGNNFSANRCLFEGNSISFVGLAQVWGWATWANRWNKSEKNAFYLLDNSRLHLRKWKISPQAKSIKSRHVESLCDGLDAWDYQWQVSILNSGALAVSPSSNLISNMGDGADATHTRFDTERTWLPVEPLKSFKYSKISVNKGLTCWYEHKMGLRNQYTQVKFGLLKASLISKKFLRKLIRKFLFLGVSPVVIASTGRSGSTMLTMAVAESFASVRFKWLPKSINETIKNLSVGYLDRISDIYTSEAPVLKTHDIYQSDFKDDAKFIFVYGDPLESAQSVAQMGEKNGDIWVEEHIYHLVGKGDPREIFEKDVLNYEGQLSSWGAADGVFIVHYDDLWDRVDELGEFLGFQIKLPVKRDRSEKYSQESYNIELFDRLKKLEIIVKEERG